MGQVASDIIPTNPGQNLGSANQPWNVYALAAFVGSTSSSSLNAALSGAIRLASTDSIAWRNDANAADIFLSKSGAAANNVPADTIFTTGGGFEGPFISNAANPAATGQVRLNTTDTLNFRNNANTADVSGIDLNTDDTVTVGGANGIKQGLIMTSTANPASLGLIRLANAETIVWRDSTNSLNEGISFDSSDSLLIQASVPKIRFGGATSSFPMLKRNASQLQVRLADDSTTAALVCGAFQATGNITSFTSYNGVTVDGNQGLPIINKVLNLVTQNAAIGTTTLQTAPFTGLYRLTYYLVITTVGNAVNLTGTFGWTDESAVTHTVTTANIACNTLGANSTSALGLGSITFGATAASLITYATALSAGIGAGAYSVRLRLEFLN